MKVWNDHIDPSANRHALSLWRRGKCYGSMLLEGMASIAGSVRCLWWTISAVQDPQIIMRDSSCISLGGLSVQGPKRGTGSSWHHTQRVRMDGP